MNEDTPQPSRSTVSRKQLDGLDLRQLMAEGLPPVPQGVENIPLPNIPGFETIRLLGAGGMGIVFLARQISLDRNVAIKVLSNEGGVASQFFDRLEIEAQSMAKVSHPNTVQVYDFLRLEDGSAAVVMEWIDGGNLREIYLSSGEPVHDWHEAVRIARDVAASLEVAHNLGIIHRDVKPENVLMTDKGVVKVTDFGLSRSMDSQPMLTVTGVYVGTPGYMSPEQLKGQEVDGRTDVYALGAMLYEMLTGSLPQGHFDPPRKVRSEIPVGLSELVMRCLRSKPDERLSSVGEFLPELDQALRPSRRKALLAAGLAGLLIAGGGLATTFLQKPRFPRSRPLRGEWVINDNVLQSDDDRAVLAIDPGGPVFPSNVKIRFTRLEGVYSIALFFRHPTGWGSCELSAWDDAVGGVQLINGDDVRSMNLPDMFILELENGREYEWETRLRPDSITMLIDGQVYLRRDIVDAQFNVSFPWDWDMIDTEGESLAIGSFQSPTAFHGVEVERADA